MKLYHTTASLAELWGVLGTHIAKWCGEGRLEAEKVDDRWRIDWEYTQRIRPERLFPCRMTQGCTLIQFHIGPCHVPLVGWRRRRRRPEDWLPDLTGGVKDSARDRKALDPHAECCIRWLCPFERARRRFHDLPRSAQIRGVDSTYIMTGDHSIHIPWGGDGCRRVPSLQPLASDDTSWDNGSPQLWDWNILPQFGRPGWDLSFWGGR